MPTCQKSKAMCKLMRHWSSIFLHYFIHLAFHCSDQMAELRLRIIVLLFTKATSSLLADKISDY